MYIIYPPSQKNWGHHALAVLALLLLFPLLKLCPGTALESLPSAPSQTESADHQLTLQIEKAGGIFAMIRGFYRGESQWKEVYPLYPVVLMSVAQRDPSDFARNARALNFILILVFAALFFWTLRRSEGEVFGFLAIVAFFAIPFFSSGIPLAGPQWLALLSAYMAWFNLVEETDDDAKGMTAGLWAGAAFLTSPLGGGLFLIGLLYFFLNQGVRAFSKKGLWNFTLSFLAVSSPLLVRDYWLHSNPFHSFIPLFSFAGWPSAEFLKLKIVWALGIMGILGILFDPDRGRKILSALYLAVLLIFIRNPATSFILSFYSAAVVSTLLAKTLGKGSVWLALPAAAALCGLAWYDYYY